MAERLRELAPMSAETREVWQPRLGRDLSRDEAKQIAANIRRLPFRPGRMTIGGRAFRSVRRGRQGAGALPCRLRPARSDRRPSGARPVGNERAVSRRASPVTRRSRRCNPIEHQAQRGRAGDLAGHDAAAEETPVATYLRSRGPDLPPPPSLRFHAGLKHPSGGVWPAMVALVTHGADRIADRHSPHLSRPRRRRKGAGRSGRR